MRDDDRRAARLADEFRTLLERTRPPVFEVSLGLIDAYTLVALLQLLSRHPRMSDDQRYLAVRIASAVARMLADAAREGVGPESEIETTLMEGFDPERDLPIDEDLDDDATPFETSEGGRYVSPTWARRLEELDMELSKCAACGRFFVSHVPIRLFTSSEPVLGYELCDACAGAVLGVHRPEDR